MLILNEGCLRKYILFQRRFLYKALYSVNFSTLFHGKFLKNCFHCFHPCKGFEKLMKKYSTTFCSIIDYIYQNTSYFIRSGNYLAEYFNTCTVVPQGY